MAKAKRRSEDIAYKVYVTDALKMIAESAAGGDRKYMAVRFYDTLNLKQEKKENRTPDEIIERVKKSLRRAREEK